MLQHATILSRCADERSLSVELERCGDQWTQRILATSPAHPPLTLLEAAPGRAPERGRLVLQELNLESLPDGRGTAAALMGQSFDCLWSLTIEPIGDAQGPALLFDVACRLKSSGARLFAVYAAPQPIALQSNRVECVLQHPAAAFRCAATSIAGQEPLAELHADAQTLYIAYDATQRRPLPATLRWRWVIRST
jgi:hypothetical protein